MSTRTVPIEQPLTPEQALLTDRIGNEVYASHYAERKAYRLILGCGTVLPCGSMWLNFSLAHRPIVNRYIRIDEMGRAQAIQYSDLDYTPAGRRSPDVSHRLGQLPLYDQPRHDRDQVPAELLFPLAIAGVATDGRRQPESPGLAGDRRADRAKRCGGQRRHHYLHVRPEDPGANIARGTALVAIDRVYSPDHSHQPRTEHWMLSVTYYLNPKQVSDQAKIFPQFETINPLGLTITEFHENRVSVDPMTPGSAASIPPGGVR